MKSKVAQRIGVALVAEAIVAVGFGQTVSVHSMQEVKLDASCVASQMIVFPVPGSAHVLREIDDPNTGTRWLLIRDHTNSGGPGRLVPAGCFPVTNAHNPGVMGILRIRTTSTPLHPKLTALLPVIRAGDRLVVEEHSAVVDAQLEAVALGPAAVGAALNVRLDIGGKVSRARALGQGRAVFVPETGAQP